eukprot:GHVT01082424.1.p1 GENE.GHVT01082424.1~~GHVT01082424.1.p1  ORF type:complete len:213 (+),score=39.76 GHVT01082424.1:545-1183(+)
MLRTCRHKRTRTFIQMIGGNGKPNTFVDPALSQEKFEERVAKQQVIKLNTLMEEANKNLLANKNGRPCRRRLAARVAGGPPQEEEDCIDVSGSWPKGLQPEDDASPWLTSRRSSFASSNNGLVEPAVSSGNDSLLGLSPGSSSGGSTVAAATGVGAAGVGVLSMVLLWRLLWSKLRSKRATKPVTCAEHEGEATLTTSSVVASAPVIFTQKK